jgi:hypothetical protein
VIVDDLIPCSGITLKPIYARNKNINEFWACIVEKAYAKLHGSYQAIELGFVSDGLVDMTGGNY